MTARSVVCPKCGADVPYGRLSCTACGALLASVAGSERRAAGSSERTAHEEPTESLLADEPEGHEAPRDSRRVPSTVPTPRPTGWYSTAAQPPATVGAPGVGPASRAGFFSDLPFRTPDDVSGWLVAVGAAVAAIAFVLPWAQVGVAGTRLDSDYVGRWGLANPSYLVLVAGAVVTFLLITIPSRVPLPARSVAVPIFMGGVFLGLGWAYLTGPYGTGPGVDTMSLGAVLMVVGGVLALRPSRLARMAGSAGTPADRGENTPTS